MNLLGKKANAAAGEVEIRLAGRTYVLRPTFEAIVELERETGMGLIRLMSMFNAGDYGLSLLAATITAGLHGAGESAKPAAVAEMVFKTGIADPALVLSVTQFLLNAAQGGREPDGGKPEAAD